jgi:hypothetical protein
MGSTLFVKNQTENQTENEFLEPTLIHKA